jgi:subtilisin family serine protease
MRTCSKDIYLMKKVISLVTSVFIFIGVIPSHAAEFYNSADVQSTQDSRKTINLDYAHNNGLTGKDQVIVVIDDGVNLNSQAFAGKVIDGYCSSKAVCGEFFLKSGANAGANHRSPGMDGYPSHGSLVAGVAAGNKTSVFPGGVAPDAKIISINNRDGNHEGIILALDWILSIVNKYNIVAVNASFGYMPGGSRFSSDYCPKTPDIDERIKKLYDMGIAFVAASGNNGSYDSLNYPACNPLTISVGATNRFGTLESYSNTGRELAVVAPAGYMGVSGDGNGYWIGGGTSTAAPVTAGAVAILKQYNPKLTVDQIKKSLMTSDKYLKDVIYNNLPLLNLKTSLEAIKTNTFSNVVISKTDTTVVSQPQTNSSELSSALSKVDELQKELEKLKQESATLKNKIASLDSEKTTLNGELLNIKNEVGILKDESVNLKKINSDLSRKNKALCTILKRKSAFC